MRLQTPIIRLYFNPRFREGSDTAETGIYHRMQYFNPRFREGSDALLVGRKYQYCWISIHASAREATPSKQILDILHQFQSTLPRGKRRNLQTICLQMILFQSTLPRGKRRKERKRVLQLINFNPRFREGSDTSLRKKQLQKQNFNPRFREGSDLMYQDTIRVHYISIHASAREATI